MGRNGARRLGAAAALAVLLPVAPGEARAQDDLDAACSPAGDPSAECALAAAGIRSIQPRIALALWGGSPVPGNASTLGMRLGPLPRISLSSRVTLLPLTLPPLTDRAAGSAGTGMVASVSTQATIGLLPGFSPLPTIGGLFSLDVTGRASYMGLPVARGFDDGSDAVWGVAAGLRLGLLRESFTLPGASITATIGRSTEVAYGDPDTQGTWGFAEGSITGLNATASATKRLGAAGLTLGVAYDRLLSGTTIGYRATPSSGQIQEEASARTEAWSGFGAVSWSFLILHASLEGGWQSVPVPDGLPTDVELSPAGWWLSGALRLSI